MIEYGKSKPEKIKEINGVRVCCLEEFLIGMGSDGTRVYVGLGKDGYEKAVKRLRKDSSIDLAEQERKTLNELNPASSKHVVNYYSLDDQSDDEYLFLILDLCEETLQEFINRAKLDNQIEIAPDSIIQPILQGLADLHRSRTPILHRDIKPRNILRNVHDNWLLADFGISRILTEGATTWVSEQRGTEFWRAVETYRSDGTSGHLTARYKKESDIQV